MGKGNLAGIILALQLILLLAALDQTVVTTAIPKIVADLKGFDRYAWVTTAYLLTSTLAVPIFGKLSDQFGRKLILQLGLFSFLIASLLCGVSGLIGGYLDGMSQLILARSFQGLGAGIMLALTFIVIGDVFAPSERGKYQGLFASVFIIASLIGPMLGGYITDAFSWRWVFFINVPLGLLAWLVFNRSFVDTYFANSNKPAEKQVIDYLGMLLLSSFVVSLLVSVGQLASKTCCWWLVVASLMFIAFVWRELKAYQPILPLQLFANAVISISCISVFVSGIGMFGSILLIPLLLEKAMGVSAMSAGSLMAPLMIVVAIASIISGLVVAKLCRYKIVVLVGWSLMLVGTLLLSTMTVSTSLLQMVMIMMIVGAGMGLLLPVYTVAIQNASPKNMLGIATSLSQFFRQMGGTLGTAVFGSLMLCSYYHRIKTGYSVDLPTQLMHALNNPLIVGNQLKTACQLVSPQISTLLMAHARQSLIGSINDVFFAYAIVLFATLLMNCFLPDIVLQKVVQPTKL